MKRTILGILILFSMNLNGQDIDVKFIQANCENDDWDSRERHVSIYKEDSLIIKHPKNRLGEFKLEKLEFGSYRIQLTNIFGQEIEEKILIDSATKEVTFCIDTFKETDEKTFISELQESDKFEIIYSSMGCFHWDKERIKIYHKNGEWYIDYFVNSEIKKSKKLSSNDLEELIEFERRLRQMGNSMGGCTTSDEYTIKINGKEQVKITDDSCDWNGYYKMKRKIIGIKE